MYGRSRARLYFSKKCLERGISVSTSNKELVAAKGDELLAIARANNAIISLKQALAALFRL